MVGLSFPVTLSNITVVVHASHLGTPLDCGDSSNYAFFAHWKHAPPLTVYFKSDIPSPLLLEVKLGRDAWDNEEHPAGALTSLLESDSADIVVTWGAIDGAGNTLAQTASTIENGIHVIHAVITFDSDESWGTGVALSCSSPTPVSVIDVSTHEFGHALIALGDRGDAALTMYGFYFAAGRTLAAGDKLGVENQQWHSHGGGGGHLCIPACPDDPSG